MDQRILFRLTTEHLIVANTGTVFSKEGLKSIVYTDTSSKISNQKTFPDSKKQAQDHISMLIQRKCNTFKDLDELASANGTDKRTAGDYSERLLLELLQNAIDAGGGEQIGNKGIGFRSVLNGINIIEIHSGHYHVRWSDQDAIKTLEQNQIDTEDKKPPLLALPAWCENKNGEIQTLLDDGYITVIRLTLTERGVNSVKEEWEQFSNDPSLLLFINNSIELKWERGGYPQIQWNRNQMGEIVTVEIKENGNPAKTKNWRQFQSGGAIAAYIADKDRRFQENKDGNPLLYSFFPAALSPHPFPNLYLHHSEFDLQSNRQAVKIDEDDQCLKDLSEAIMKATSSIENESDFLDLLKLNRHPLNQDEETESKIWGNVLPQLVKKEFKGIGDRRLVDIKSCPKNEQMPHSMRDENRWEIWEAFLLALESKRPNGLFDLCVFQPGTENKQREETLLHFNPDSPFTKEEIQKLSWAPVESSDHAVSSSKIKIFLPSEKPIQRPPDDIEVRFLTSDFLEFFKSKDDDAISFLKVILGVYEFSAMGVIEHCVLPKLETTQKHGASKELIEFLKSLKEADPKEAKASVDYFDWENPVRSKLARNLYLKCQEKYWPVIHVYVDGKWTGNNFLENVYGVNRGFLEFDPPENEDDKISWENFWKWLGVGWCPKVMPLLDSIVCKTRDHQGLNWNDTTKIFQGNFFGGNAVPDNWLEYCNALILIKKDSDIFERKPRIKKNWTIDGGHKLLETQDAFHIICSNWQVYEKWMSAMIAYSSNKRNDDDNHKSDLPSYLHWLIQTIPWVPCDDGSYYEGYKVFLKNSQVVRKIPQFVNVLNMPESDDDRQEEDPFREEFIKKCGIRSKWKEVEDSDWESWLIKASGMKTNNENNSDHCETIRLMYRSLIDHRKIDEGNQWRRQPVQPIENISLWGIEYPGDKNEKWHLCDPTSLPYFVDRGDLADIGLPGLYLFPVRLDGLSKKVKTHFGLFSLSDTLIGEPLYEGELCPQFTLKAGERINELVAYLRVDNKKYSDEEFINQINSLSVNQVNGLKVKFFIDGSDLGDPIYQKKYRRKNQDNSWTIFFDESGCSDAERWEFFAETLLLSCGSDMDKEANIRDLLQYPSDELHGKMLRLGVAPETIEDLKRKKESDQKPEETHIPPPQEEPDEPPNTIDPPYSPPLPVRPPIIPPPGNPEAGDNPPQTPPGGGDVPPNRPHPEKGMEAQHWLFNEVKKWCQDRDLPTPLEEQEKEDITIPLNPSIIIEVKRIKGATVFWSQRQIEKAFLYKKEGYPQKYTIALINPNSGTNEVYWVINPLSQLQFVDGRKIQWSWFKQTGKNYDLGSWDQPETPPQKISDRYSAVIPVDTDWIRKLPKGISQGLELIVHG